MRQIRDGRRPERAWGWTMVYLLFAGAIGLMYLEGRATMPNLEHRFALLGIIVLFFALLLLWEKTEESIWR